MRNSKKLWHLVKSHWQLLAILGLAGLALGFLMLYRLGSLAGGLSDREIAQQTFSSSWRTIAHDPLNAPLTVIQWLLLTVFSHHGQTIARLPSVGFGVLTLVAFVYVLRRWYGLRTAVFGTVLFGFSSWFLHSSRLGTTDVLYLWAVPTLLALHIAWQRHAAKPVVSYLIMALLTVMLYIPGLLWPILISLLLQTQSLIMVWQQLRRWWLRGGLVIMFVVLLVPLGLAFWHTPELLRTWLGLPANFLPTTDIMKRLGNSLSFFVYHGPQLPELWLDKLPLLDIFSMVMAAAGAIFYARHILLPRTRLLLSLFIIGAAFFALNGPVAFSILVPLVYLVIAAGVGYLLHEWLRVFPRNPLARSIGFGLLGTVIVLSCAYNFRAYFVAWPHNARTLVTFHTRR